MNTPEFLQHNKVSELAYRLQIDITFPLIEDIKKVISLIQERQNYVPVPIERKIVNNYTFIMHKDIFFLSDNQLVFISELSNMYAFDRHDDIEELIRLGYNPFSKLKFTEENIKKLRENINSVYPNVYVDELPEEIKNIFNPTPPTEFKNYEVKMHELINRVSDLGLDYDVDNIYNFAKLLKIDDYSLFLRYKPINQELSSNILSRENAASETLGYILLYLDIIPDAKQSIVLAISDFMYFIVSDIEYEDFLIEKSEMNEDVWWVPDFCEYEYYADGTLKSLYYLDLEGNISGSYTCFYENGDKKSEVEYLSGEKHGSSFTWYKDGQISEISQYSNGLKNGTCTKYYSNGSKKYKGNFINGNPTGLFKVWRSTGEYVGFRNFIQEKKYKRENTTREYFVLNEIKDGEFIEMNTHGKIIKIGMYILGKREENWEINKNGKSKYGKYISGKKEGLWKISLGSGKIEKKYLSGVLQGEYIEYDKNFKILTKGLYIQGKRNGFWIETNYYGTKMTGEYISGIKNGVWEITHLDDEFESITYLNGLHNGAYSMKSSDKIIISGEYKDDLRSGKWIENFSSKIYEVEYISGKKNGNFQCKYLNGNYVCGEYKDDLKSGYWVEKISDKVNYGKYFRGFKINIWKTYNFAGDFLYQRDFDIKTLKDEYIKVRENYKYFKMFLRNEETRFNFYLDVLKLNILDPVILEWMYQEFGQIAIKSYEEKSGRSQEYFLLN